jgi:hypothetical protein
MKFCSVEYLGKIILYLLLKIFPFLLKWFMCRTKESLPKNPIWCLSSECSHEVKSSWNVMAHSDVREGKWRGNWRMEWVASILHTISEHGVSSITTADAHTSAASSRLNWRPADLNRLVRFAERQNLVSARVPSHFKRFLTAVSCI